LVGVSKSYRESDNSDTGRLGDAHHRLARQADRLADPSRSDRPGNADDESSRPRLRAQGPAGWPMVALPARNPRGSESFITGPAGKAAMALLRVRPNRGCGEPRDAAQGFVLPRYAPLPGGRTVPLPRGFACGCHTSPAQAEAPARGVAGMGLGNRAGGGGAP